MLEVRPFSPRDRRFISLCGRRQLPDRALFDGVSASLDAIAAGGTVELLRQARQTLPGISSVEELRIDKGELSESRGLVSEQFLTAISLARVNIRKFHEYQRRLGYVHDDGDGVRLTRRVRPLAQVGIIARSSCPALLMCAVPAQVAGVGRLLLSVIPRADGSIDPRILATAKILGIDEVYRLPGPAAVAAFAHGIEPLALVDKIVGPGDAETEAAKRLVHGAVGTDHNQNLNELVVIADDGANAKFIAGDFLAQCESHPGQALALLTTDRLLAEAVRIELGRLAENFASGPALLEDLDKSLSIFVCQDLQQAVEAANAIAPARLALLARDAGALVREVENAGMVAIGPWSYEAATDGFAGGVALAPSGGASRLSSTLGVEDFIQEMTVVEYSHERLLVTGRHLMELVGEETGPARAAALRQRLDLLKLTLE